MPQEHAGRHRIFGLDGPERDRTDQDAHERAPACSSAGATVTEVLSEILKSDPDFSRLPATVPDGVKRLVERCLRKDRRTRIHDIGDVRIELDEALAPTTSGASSIAPPRPTRSARRALSLLLWALPAIAALAIARVALPLRPTADVSAVPQVIRLDVGVPLDVDLYTGQPPFGGISGDDRTLVFTGGSAGTRRVYVRLLDQDDAKPVLGTESATACFLSPDGRSIGFFSVDLTLRIGVDG